MPAAKAAPPRATSALLFLRVLNATKTRGHVQYGAMRLPCAIGRSGIKAMKREGDGATPRGRLRLRRVLIRADKIRNLTTGIGRKAIRKNDGWCDQPSDSNYNRPVKLPYATSAESLWRNDGLYDVVVVLGYNDRPRIRNRGSAIFLHIARDAFAPTEGCVALRLPDMRRLLAVVGQRCELVVGR